VPEKQKFDGQERHYNPHVLNKWFAVASILLLLGLFAVFYFDFQREWKGYQRKFRKLEARKTNQLYEKSSKDLAQNTEYQNILEQLEEAEDAFAETSSAFGDAKELLSEKQGVFKRDTQSYQLEKADYDAARYQYENALAHHGNVAATKETLDHLEVALGKRRLALESSEMALEKQEKETAAFESEIEGLNKSKKALTKTTDILKSRLEKVDTDHMSLPGKFGNLIRDMPIMEMLSPYYKVDQVVLPDIKEDLNFTKVPKVDRCMTCHKGILKSDFENEEQPFRTHPNLELFLSSASPHPVEKFACTTCHNGRGRGTGFSSAAHTPSSEAQKKAWEEKYDWQKLHLWDQPMFPKQFTQASCFKCHAKQTVIPHADQLNLGLNLIERAGCYGCHKIEKYKGRKKIGPDLRRITSKIPDKAWAYHWIQDPQGFRPDTRMPSFFGQSNNSDAESLKRSEQEILAMMEYLYHHSEPYEMDTDNVAQGNIRKGEKLVASVGCYGCHQQKSDLSHETISMNALLREQGPAFIGLGSKTNASWVYHWLKDPQSYHPNTRMPNMRLTDQEAEDIAAYLVEDKKEQFSQAALPQVDVKVLDDTSAMFLRKLYTDEQVKTKLSQMNIQEKQLYSGERLIRRYGCFACHEIKGFENTMPIGTELTEEASKNIHSLDFGSVHLAHTKEAWFSQKLKDPRIFDQHKVKAPDQKLVMPNYNFTDEEVEAIVTALLGFVKTDVGVKFPEQTPKRKFIEEGQKLIRQYNCQGCHVIEGKGGAISPTITDWLIRFEGRDKNDADAVTKSFTPPNLMGEGKKVQTEWLFDFLHHPKTIRPWLKVRMPTFTLTEEEVNSLVKYFSYLDDEPFPFVNKAKEPSAAYFHAGKKLFSADYFDCGACHIQGDTFLAGTPDRWAPDFSLAKDRLKPEWMVEWLYDPQKLSPGTKMPTYFDPEYFEETGPDDVLNGNEHEQIKALRDYIISNGQ